MTIDRARSASVNCCPPVSGRYHVPVRTLLLVALVLALGCKKDDGISAELGATCTSHADCSYRCLPGPEFPGGFCTRDCQNDGDCSSDAVCIDIGEGEACLFQCLDDRDCDFLGSDEGHGWACREQLSSAGTARLACVSELESSLADAGVTPDAMTPVVDAAGID
jgi:hypothetical protein